MTIGDVLILLAVLGAYIAIMDRLASFQSLMEKMLSAKLQRRPTPREAAGEICPSCAGKGKWIENAYSYTECTQCKGTGQI